MFAALILIGIAFVLGGLSVVVVASRHTPSRRETALRSGLAFSTACFAAAAIALVFAQLSAPRDTRLTMIAASFVILGALVGLAVSIGRRWAKSH